jgi:uncharacterized protein YcbX
MAHLGRILVYPIKSLDGARVDSATLLPSGPLQHDRRFWLTDSQGRVLNGKRTPAVHHIRATFDLATMRVALRCDHPDRPLAEERFTLSVGNAQLEAWLSEALAEPIHLNEEAATGLPDDLDAPGPTLVSEATLQTVADWFDLSVESIRRRFRANLEVADVSAFWEDRLVPSDSADGVAFSIGQARLLGRNPCQRCVVPSRNPETGEQISAFAKQFGQHRQATLPPEAPRERFNHFYRLCLNTSVAEPAELRVGDRVLIGDGLS